MATDQYGYFGPTYSIADNIPMPNEVGVRQESSISAIVDSVGAVNTYVDIIAFGGPTFMDSHAPQPLGIRYFLNTDMRCSNGATMSEYVDGVTKGDIMGTHVENALAGAGLPGLKGLAPGILENARDALDPRPILSAATGTGYPVCQKVACPVGDIQGAVTNKGTGASYLVDPVQYGDDGIPRQTRWVQAYDSTGSAIQVSQAEFAGAAKCYNADGTWNMRAPGCPSGPPADLTGGMTGSGPYGSCQLLQGPTLPPTLEGFMDFLPSQTFFGILVGILGILGILSFKRSSLLALGVAVVLGVAITTLLITKN